MVSSMHLGGVTARNETLGLHAVVDEARLDPWAWRLALTRPSVRLSPGPADTSVSGSLDTTRLPVADLPAIDIEAGRFAWTPGPDGGPAVRLTGIDLRFTPGPDADSAGRLELAVDTWSVSSDSARVAGEARLRCELRESTVNVTQLWVRAQADDVGSGTARGRIALDLVPPLHLDTELILEGATASLKGMWADVAASGRLAPLGIAVRMEGAAHTEAFGELALHLAGVVDTTCVRLDSARLAVADGALSLQGTYDTESEAIDGTATVEGVRLEELGLGGLGGKVRGRVTATGFVEQPQATLQLATDGLAGLASEPVDLRLDASLAEGTLQLGIRSRRLGNLHAAGGLSLAKGDHDLALTGDLDLGVWLGLPTSTSVRGRWRPQALEVRLRTPRLPFGDASPGPVQVEAVLRDYRTLEAALSVGAGMLRANLRADLSAGRLDTLSIHVTDLELEQLSSAAGGHLRGSAQAGGDLGPGLRGTLGVEVDELQVAGWSAGATRLTAHVDKGVAELVASAPGLEARVVIDTAGHGRLDAEMAGFVLRRAAGDPADSVRVSGQLGAEGRVQDPTAARLQLRLDEIDACFAGLPVGLLGSVTFDADQGRVSLSEARLRTPFGEVRAWGHADADSLDFVAVIDSLDAAWIEPVEARGRTEVRIDGPRSLPRVRWRLDVDDLAVGTRPLGVLHASVELSDSLRGSASLATGPTATPSFELDLVAPTADLRPGVEATGQERLRLQLRASDFDWTMLATYLLGDSTGAWATAAADVWLPTRQLVDGWAWSDLEGTVAVHDLRLDQPRVRLGLRSPATVSFRRGIVAVEEFELPVEVYRRDRQAFADAGSISLSGRSDNSGIQLQLRDIDLVAADLLLGGVALPAGSVQSRAVLTFKAGVPTLQAEAEAYLESLGRLRARLLGGAGSWDAAAVWVTPLEDSLVVTVAAPGTWPQWQEARLRALSDGIDLLVVLDQVPELETLTGTVRIDLTAESLASQPRLAGHVEVEDVELALLGVRPGYRFPAGRLEFKDGPRGDLVGLTGTTSGGEGSIEVTGFLDLALPEAIRYEARLVSTDVPYRYEDTFTAPDIDMDLALRSQDNGALLEGTVRLVRPTAEIQLVDLTSPTVRAPPAVQSEFFEDTQLNVYVDIDDLGTRSELSDMVFDGRIRIYGTFYKPRFQGELGVTEGTVVLLNRQFRFTRGRVILDRLLPTYSILDLIYDPILLEPELDMEAVTRIKPIDEEEEREVTLILQGPVLSSVPRLTSPGLGNIETLSLLAFGSTATSEAGAGYSSALYTAAGQLLLSRRVQKVGLDEFLLLPSGTVIGTVGEPAVRIGKHLSWPLPTWVRYEAATAEPSLGRFEVQYHITPWLTIDANAHSQYELYGLGLGVRRDF